MATATPPVYTETKPTVTALLYTVEEAAEALRLSRTQVYELIRDKELVAVKIGGRRRISVAACDAYVKVLYAKAMESAA
jgi:excisionase family DNA binding protein